ISESDFYKNLFQNLYHVGVFAVDRHKRISFWNRASERLVGYPSSAVVGKQCLQAFMVHVDEAGCNLCAQNPCPAEQVIRTGKPYEKELYFRHREGYSVPVFLRITPIKNRQGRILGATEVFRDNGSSLVARQMIEDLETMTLIDPLTKLGNRRCAEKTLYARLDEKNRYDWPFGILFIDVDHFKEFNDRYGHKSGDRVLQMVADTLRESVRSFDTVSRWGGEEFLAVITNVKDDKKLALIAEKCRRRVEEKGITIGDAKKGVTISVGGTLATPEDTLETLISRGDRLMYRSKEAGRNRVFVDPRQD
ncbi:MAG: GGDEF domain-containing protein, partial [bacterium]|nr:GGDEF domain-containing protein [bacterium]